MVKTLLRAWIIATSAMSLVALPDIADEAFIDECVGGHNRARSSVMPAASDMLYMVGVTDITALTTNADVRPAKLQPGGQQKFYI